MRSNGPGSSAPPSLYSREYYLSVCGGWEEFARSQGRTLPKRLERSLALAGSAIRPGARLLDIGAGRGEFARHAAARGAHVFALDFSWASCLLVKNGALSARPGGVVPLSAHATALPMASASADVVFMLDLVEHLEPAELARAVGEVRRVLAPDGLLVIHTAPNLTYYRLGYPLYRGVMHLRGIRLPHDPRDRIACLHEMHVNEQTPRRLRRVLREAGMVCSVFLETTDDYRREKNPFVRGAMKLLVRAPILKKVFCDDIFALAWKPGRRRTR